MMGRVQEQLYANDISNPTTSPHLTYTNQQCSKPSTNHQVNGPKQVSLALNSSQPSSPATKTAISASQPIKPQTQQWPWSKPTSSLPPPTRGSCSSTKKLPVDTSLKSFSDGSTNMERMCKRMQNLRFQWIISLLL